jgi:hypothetical protein
LETGQPPIAFLGHSFGTLQAYESAYLLQESYQFNVAHIISLAGVSFDYLRDLPIYQDNYDPRDKFSFEERFQEEAVATFGEVPGFVLEGHPSYNAAMKAYTVEGRSNGVNFECSYKSRVLTIISFLFLRHNLHDSNSQSSKTASIFK